MYKRVVLSENLNVFAMSDIKTFCRLTGSIASAITALTPSAGDDEEW